MRILTEFMKSIIWTVDHASLTDLIYQDFIYITYIWRLTESLGRGSFSIFIFYNLLQDSTYKSIVKNSSNVYLAVPTANYPKI